MLDWLGHLHGLSTGWWPAWPRPSCQVLSACTGRLFSVHCTFEKILLYEVTRDTISRAFGQLADESESCEHFRVASPAFVVGKQLFLRTGDAAILSQLQDGQAEGKR